MRIREKFCFELFIGILIVLQFVLLTGCIETKIDTTLNPDGSGKSVVEAFVSTKVPDLDIPPTDNDGSSTAKSYIKDSKGVEAWKDVVYKRLPDGRIYFKGTAYFKDFSKLKIHNAGTNLTLTREANTITIQTKPATAKTQSKKVTGDAKTELEMARKQWNAMKPIMTQTLGSMKDQEMIRVPGKIVEYSNFTKIDDSTVQLSISGESMIKMMDAAMNDEKTLEMLMARQKAGQQGLPADDDLNEKLFGKKGPVQVKIQINPQPLFDYNAEVAPARVQYANLMKTLEITESIDVTSESGGLQFAVSKVRESRSTQESRSEMEIEVSVKGELLLRAGNARAIQITKAVDESGNSLIPTDHKSEREFFSTAMFRTRNEDKEVLKLQIPKRNVSTIRQVSGIMEFADPIADPKGRIVVKKFMKENGKLIQALKAHKIEIAIFSSAELEKQKNQKADTQQSKIFSRLQSAQSLEPNELLVLIEDPEKRLLNFEILNSKGEPYAAEQKSYIGSFGGMAIVLKAEPLPPPDAQLALYVMTPKAMVKIPFELNNIPLP